MKNVKTCHGHYFMRQSLIVDGDYFTNKVYCCYTLTKGNGFDLNVFLTLLNKV
jgi:hypothetical protein